MATVAVGVVPAGPVPAGAARADRARYLSCAVTSLSTAIGTGLALLVAGAMVLLALSLPGIAVEGAVVALLSLAAAAMAWSHTSEPQYTFAVLGLQVVAFAAWTFPWFRYLPALPRLGSVWLGVAVWLLGTVSALQLSPTIGIQRLIYAGIAVLMFVRGRQRTGRDVTVGLVACVLVGLAVIVAAGSGNFFSLNHYVSPGPGGTGSTPVLGRPDGRPSSQRHGTGRPDRVAADRPRPPDHQPAAVRNQLTHRLYWRPSWPDSAGSLIPS